MSAASKLSLLCLVAALAFVPACMRHQDEGPSAFDKARAADNQKRHFRPVHRDHPTWRLVDSGQSLILQTPDEGRFRARLHRHEKQTTIRQATHVAATVTSHDNALTMTSTVPQPGFSTITLKCVNTYQASLLTDTSSQIITFDDNTAKSDKWTIERIGRHRFSIAQNHNSTDEHPANTTVRLPFSSLGTLLFHLNDLPLAARFALAMHVTGFHFSCDG